MTVLIVGATGSIGRLVVDEALGRGHVVRALTRNQEKASGIPAAAEVVIGDVTHRGSLHSVISRVDAIVFTLGSDGLGEAGAETVNYGGVRNVLVAVDSRAVRIVLMTAIGVTARTGSYPWPIQVHDWKRRSERLVRASGLPYTIVRPGWFDRNAADQHRLVLVQGDRRQAGDISDGVVARLQIAQVLVGSLSSDHALRKTFQVVAEAGPTQGDLDSLFAALDADSAGALDGVEDLANMSIDREPQGVRDDLKALRGKLWLQ